MTHRLIAKRNQDILVLALVFVATFVAGAPLEVSASELSFANSGSAAAQDSFLHGLAQLHNFEYETAAEDFRQAQAIDSQFCMAYWGEAMTYNHPIWFQQNRRSAETVLDKLGTTEEARLAKCGTERERDYMSAVDILYFGNGTKYQRDFEYADAMAKLYAKYPDDVDAGAFYALAILGTAHYGRDFAIYMKALAVLEPLFYSHPDHPGVNHYLIHSVDDPIHAPLGLAAARNYSKIALDAPHAQHMTSHIFVALGMWDDVVKANMMAATMQNEQNARRGRPAEYCSHYTSWLEYGYLQAGRLSRAKQVLAECHSDAVSAIGSDNPEDLGKIGYYAQMRSRYLLDTGEWDGDVAHWPAISTEDHDPDLIVTFAFVDGFAAIRRGDLQAAKRAYADVVAADNAANSKPLPPGVSPNADMKRITILHQQLTAMLDAANGNKERAVDLLHQAAASETAMPVEFGPPFIDKPTQELLGEMLLKAGRPTEAKAAFEVSLASAPKRTQSLVGLWHALKAVGDTDTAGAVAANLHEIWHSADAMPIELH